MKALTLTQPWATLVAIGAKSIETRSWYAGYRGPIAIHAAKTFPADCRALCSEEPFRTALCGAGFAPKFCAPLESTPELPLGAVVATATLFTCLRIGEGDMQCAADIFGWLKRPMWPDFEFGDFTPGRFAWVLDDIKALKEPIVVRGSLGLWEFPR